MRRLASTVVTVLVLAACTPSAAPNTTTTTTPPTTTSTTATSAATSAGGPLRFVTVELVDADTGWGLTVDGRVVRTVDGGATWTDVTPERLPDVAAVDFGDDRAWVVTGGGEVWVGSDGGADWDVTAVPLEAPFDVVDVAFSDPDRGWMLVAGPGGAGTIPVAVVATGDGGRTWQVVAVPSPDPEVAALERGHSSGLGVGGDGRLWVTKDIGPRPEAWLAVSWDGGRSWTERVVDVDGGEFCGTYAPHLDGARFGALIVRCDDGGAWFAMTGDDGETWDVAALPGPAAGLVVFEDGAVAWGRDLYATVEPPGVWETLWTFDAVPSSLSLPDAVHGLAVVDGELWRTDTGGERWVRLSPALR